MISLGKITQLLCKLQLKTTEEETKKISLAAAVEAVALQLDVICHQRRMMLWTLFGGGNVFTLF